MTDFTPTPITINPLWVTLGVAFIRWGLTTAGAATASEATDLAPKVVGGLVTVATLAWSAYSWFRAHEKAKALNAAPAGSAVVK